jgi:hypothetical protein
MNVARSWRRFGIGARHYPLDHADALKMPAQIERTQAIDKAMAAASGLSARVVRRSTVRSSLADSSPPASKVKSLSRPSPKCLISFSRNSILCRS